MSASGQDGMGWDGMGWDGMGRGQRGDRGRGEALGLEEALGNGEAPGQRHARHVPPLGGIPPTHSGRIGEGRREGEGRRGEDTREGAGGWVRVSSGRARCVTCTSPLSTLTRMSGEWGPRPVVVSAGGGAPVGVPVARVAGQYRKRETLKKEKPIYYGKLKSVASLTMDPVLWNSPYKMTTTT